MVQRIYSGSYSRSSPLQTSLSAHSLPVDEYLPALQERYGHREDVYAVYIRVLLPVPHTRDLVEHALKELKDVARGIEPMFPPTLQQRGDKFYICFLAVMKTPPNGLPSAIKIDIPEPIDGDSVIR